MHEPAARDYRGVIILGVLSAVEVAILAALILLETPLTPHVHRMVETPVGVFALVMSVVGLLIVGMWGFTSWAEARGGNGRMSEARNRASLETPRLSLRPCAPEHLLALIEEPERFERLAALRAADGLPAFFLSGGASAEWLAALRRAAGPDPWRHGFFVVHHESGSVIGIAAFKGPPDAAGTVEIAYGIVPRFEGQGYATEAAAALVRFALASGQVRLVRAHTLPAANASTRVLLQCGFRHTGMVVDPDDGPVWRWERLIAERGGRQGGGDSCGTSSRAWC